MKPTIVIFSQAPLRIGGIERNILQLVEKLGKSYAFHIAGPIAEDFRQAIRALDRTVELHFVPRASKYDLFAVIRFARLFRRLRAHLVHTVEPRSRILGHAAARLAGVRTVHTFQIAALSYDDLTPIQTWVYRRVESFYNRRVSDRIIFVSERDRQLYAFHRLIKPATATVIYNSVDLAEVAPVLADKPRIRVEVRSKLEIPRKTVLACTVGRLSVQKGLDYLIEAVFLLCSETNRTRDRLLFIIVGDGELHDDLRELARARGIDDRVRFLGAKPKAEVYRLLAASDFFVLPSRFECFPFSIVEALSVGLPCVVSDVGGNSESVEHEYNGLVVPKGDVSALAAALGRLADDDTLRTIFGRNALEKVKSFSTDKMARDTERVYRALLPEIHQKHAS